jgi:hypothetical protein
MPTKPRPLGNKARDYVDEVETELAATQRRLDKLDTPNMPLLVRIITLDAARHLAEARRLLARLMALRD